MKNLIYYLAKYVGVFTLCRWLTRSDLRILAYHGIWLGPGHFGNFLYMSAEKFTQRMQKLRDMKVPVLPLDEALKRQADGTLQNNTVVITIDDGWYSSYRYMVPALLENKLPATLYITSYYSEAQLPVANVAVQYMLLKTAAPFLDTACLGDEQSLRLPLVTIEDRAAALDRVSQAMDTLGAEPARQDLLRKLAEELQFDFDKMINEKWFHLVDAAMISSMAEQGVDIQLHTHRHRISERGQLSLEREIADNRHWLEPLVSRPLEHFCYPSGIYEEAAWAPLAELNVRSATTTEPGLCRRDTPPYAIPRILDGEQVSDIEFEAELAGFGEMKRRLLSVLR